MSLTGGDRATVTALYLSSFASTFILAVFFSDVFLLSVFVSKYETV